MIVNVIALIEVLTTITGEDFDLDINPCQDCLESKP